MEYFYSQRDHFGSYYILCYLLSVCVCILYDESVFLVPSGVSVHWLGDFVFVESGLGVRLKFDMENTVYLTVTAEHLAVTRGLCGVYNNNPDGENVWPGLTYLQNLTLHSFHAFLMHYILAVFFMQYAMRCFYFIQMTSPAALEVCLSMLPALETRGVFKISKARWETPSGFFLFLSFLYNWKS